MKKVTSQTIARTIILILALLNQVLAVLGKGTLDILEEDIYQVVSLVFTIVSSIIAWWKNNSFTQAAIEADEYLADLRKEE